MWDIIPCEKAQAGLLPWATASKEARECVLGHVVAGKGVGSEGTQVMPAVVVWIKMACVGSYI